MLPAEPSFLPLGTGLLPVDVIAVPDVEQRQKIRIRMPEKRMHPVSPALFIQGPFPGVTDTQSRSDHRRLGQAMFPLRLKQNPGNPGIQGHPGHFPSPFRQEEPAVLPFDRSQFLQGLVSVLDMFQLGRVHERKPGRMAQFQIDHPQNDLGQVGAQDFRRGEPLAGIIIIFRIKPDANPFLDPSAPAFPLIGRGPGYGPDRQAAGPGPRLILCDPGQAGIHHIPDTRNGQGCFRHIGRHHNF